MLHIRTQRTKRNTGGRGGEAGQMDETLGCQELCRNISPLSVMMTGETEKLEGKGKVVLINNWANLNNES